MESRQLLSAQIVVEDTLGAGNDHALPFEAVLIGESSAEETFTVTNTGDSNLSLTNFVKCGADEADFDLAIEDSQGNPLDPSDLNIAADDFIIMRVVFQPGGIGERIGHLSFNTNDLSTGNGAITLDMTGAGNDPPADPSGPLATVDSSSQITLSWTDNSDDEAGFKIYQSTSAEGPFALVATADADATSVALTGLTGFTHYYFQVKSYSAGGLSEAASADATTTAQADPALNDAATTPYNIGTLTGPKIYRNYVGTDDLRDYYKLRMSAAGRIKLSLSEMTGPVAVTVFRIGANNSLSTLATRTVSGSTTFSVTAGGAGYYLVRVASSAGSSTNYRLALTPDYAGDTLATARNIGALGSTTRTYYDAIGSSDGNDYYRFTLSSTKTLRLSLTQLGLDADVELLNSSGVRITASENSGTTNESITRRLGAGTYYIRITAWQPSSDASYKLALSAS